MEGVLVQILCAQGLVSLCFPMGDLGIYNPPTRAGAAAEAGVGAAVGATTGFSKTAGPVVGAAMGAAAAPPT
jgi:hypothetical protein